MTISEIKQLQESEHHVEFKQAETQYNYKNGRRSILGYIVALANEGGGKIILGVQENKNGLHVITGSKAWEGKEGKLKEDIYRDLKIRIETEVLYKDDKRVLIIHVPSRPMGKTLKFEDVPLMRVGEDLLPMSDEQLFKILSEQEPDFSAKICNGLTIADLDETAILKMKKSYAKKQNNPDFIQLGTEQALIDLKLLENGKLNYAALILLGKTEVIDKKLPQSKTVWEYRNEDSQIHHDTKIEIDDPLFIAIDKIWSLINQPNLNRKHPIQSGAYIFDIFDFNEIVIREAVLNAIAHRDYTITSEVVIKQYPNRIIINNPGGFPIGVTIDNILTVSSTPRSRLITEVLEKTGLVERSGQGVDKIFSITLSEGKDEPNYNNSDLLQVSLILKTEIVDQAFHIFINDYKNSGKEPKLGVEQIITLYKIRNGVYRNLKSEIVNQLEKMRLVEKTSGRTFGYTLSKEYHNLIHKDSKIGKRYTKKEIKLILFALQENTLKMGELESQLSGLLNRNQIKYLANKLCEDNILSKTGKGSGTVYTIHNSYISLKDDELLRKVSTDLYKIYNN